MTALRLALLVHSTNPRGGVAHALALGEALNDLGHDATVFAPDAHDRGFGREVRCRTQTFPVPASGGDLLQLVRDRVRGYVDFFERCFEPFDVYHAHDGISANALATLARRGRVEQFVRTVHHLDDFADARLSRLQDRSVLGAQELICVSRWWAEQVRRRYGRHSAVIANGVDLARFSPTVASRDAELREKLRLGKGPVFLSVGGIEPRKNSIRMLRAFREFHRGHPSAQLVVAGGASLLDHSWFREEFEAELSRLSLPTRRAVLNVGVVSDGDVPPLMRNADALLFPSLKEGFGLVVLEAMACGRPVVLSHIAPFTEFYAAGECLWCDPTNVESIATAMGKAIDPGETFRQRSLSVAKRFPWSAAAMSHQRLYRSLVRGVSHARNAV